MASVSRRIRRSVTALKYRSKLRSRSESSRRSEAWDMACLEAERRAKLLGER